MRRSPITVAGLMAVTLVLGIGLAGLRSGTSLWAGVVLTMTLAILLGSVLGIVHRRGRGRAFWTGFALFGWGYLIAAEGPWFRTDLAPHLITSRLIGELDLTLHPPPQSSQAVLEIWDDLAHDYVKTDVYRLWETNRLHFRRIGHALLALVLAPIGGLISVVAFARGERDDEG